MSDRKRSSKKEWEIVFLYLFPFLLPC
jgi:hypothetical protein